MKFRVKGSGFRGKGSGFRVYISLRAPCGSLCFC